MGSPVRALAAVALLGGLLLAFAARAEPVLEFLYVEANEGDSSGGHAALRLGGEVFHFQYHPGRLLRLERIGWPGFRHVYGRLGNRRIHTRRVAAAPGTGALLRAAFSERLLAEEAQSRFLDALHADVALIEALGPGGTAAARAVSTLAVEGAGSFSLTGIDGEPGIRALRERLAREHGSLGLGLRIEAARDALRALRPDSPDEGLLVRAAATPLAFSRTFSQRVADALARLRALETIAFAPALAPDAFHAPPGDRFALDEAEKRALAHAVQRLEARLVALLDSPHADAGRTLLVGLARLAALSRSLESGHLVFLDTFPADPVSARPSHATARPEALAALGDDAKAALGAARSSLVWSEEPGEAELSALEAAANRVLELDAAPGEPRAPRLRQAALLPARSVLAAGDPLPEIPSSDREAALATARSRASAFDAWFHESRRYDLWTRNCVTELFRAIDAGFAAAGEEPREAARVRLGGFIDAGAFARFIPFVADAAVAGAWRIEATRVLPSEREARMASLAECEPALAVALRESNTLTSTIYRSGSGDSYFLFFTDDVPIARPLLGALNLAAGLGQAAAGLALSPFDRGETLRAGAAGALFSLPELVFASLRKGTLAWVPPLSAGDESSPDALVQQSP